MVTKETDRLVDGHPALDVVIFTEQQRYTAYARYVLSRIIWSWRLWTLGETR
jgi:hypothetical protein